MFYAQGVTSYASREKTDAFIKKCKNLYVHRSIEAARTHLIVEGDSSAAAYTHSYYSSDQTRRVTKVSTVDGFSAPLFEEGTEQGNRCRSATSALAFASAK